MAVSAVEGLVFWERAMANPETVFIQVTAFLKRSIMRNNKELMTETVRSEIRASMHASVKAGLDMTMKWIAPQCARHNITLTHPDLPAQP